MKWPAGYQGQGRLYSEAFGVGEPEDAARPEGRLRIGTALAEMSRKIGLTSADVDALEQTRDIEPAEPLQFE